MQTTLVILTYLTLVSAEPVVLGSGEPRFSALPRMTARASRIAGLPDTPTEWWVTAETHYPEEELFVLLRRPKRNAKPKPLLIPLKVLENIKNNEKRHIDDSSDVANEPVLLTLDLSDLDSSVQNSGLNSKRDQKKESFKDNSYTLSPVSPAEISVKADSEDAVKVNPDEFSTNTTSIDSSKIQSTNHKSEENITGQAHPDGKQHSHTEANISVGDFEQVVASSVSVGQPDEVEGRNLSQEHKFSDAGIIKASPEDGSSFDEVNKELRDSMASLVNGTSVNNIFAHPSAYSDEGEKSVLRKLLQESKLSHLRKNTSHKPETDIASESDSEISPNSSNAVLYQLADIKQLLQTHASEKNEIFLSNLDYKYNNFVEKTTSTIELLKMKFEANSDNTKEKIALILENLSTLKMMIFGQEQRILINDNRIDQFQELLHERSSCGWNDSSPDQQDTPKQQVIVNITSLDDSFSGVRLIDFNITKFMERAPQIMNNTFEDIYEKIGKLENSIASYDSKLDRYFLKRVEVPEKPDIGLSETNSLCQCNESKLQAEIDSLKNRVSLLSSSVDALKANESQGPVKSQIHEERENFELLDSPESDMVIAESRVNNFTEDDNNDAAMASKLRLLETKLSIFEEELTSIRDLRDEVALLKERVERGHLTNGSSEALCVWPYKPHGGQCYHVSTDERHNWGAARARCRELQGDLAAPRDYEAFKKFIQTQRLSRSYSFWIGASDNKEAGRWMWVSGQPVTSGVWATGHPNLLRSERCMEIRPDLRLAAAGEACRVSNYFVCQQRGA